MRKGLTRRTIGASALLALLVAGAFAVLLRAIEVQRDAAQAAARSQQVQSAANQLERLVLELEKDERGYLIGGAPRFLGPWKAARDALPGARAQLVRDAAGDAAQERRARAISDGVADYVRSYAAPLVATRDAAGLAAGEQRLDALRERFDNFMTAEGVRLAAQQAGSNADRRRAVVAATAGLAGSILLIAGFAAYMTRAVALPVRRAAAMAERVAGGDLAVRMPETGVGEVGTLERSFNSMTASLEASAIANADSRRELAASRARVLTTADETRRRIERDLHDGAQQSLTHTVITLKLARRSLGDGDGTVGELVGEALGHAERATEELRDLAHGILPASLSRGGLGAAVATLVSRIRLPVRLDITTERFPAALEATAYFIVAEALTNVVKHASADSAAVRAFAADGALHVEVSDDGIGGAGAHGRSGLLGLQDRAAALDGELHVDSPRGAGTVVSATLPIRA